MKKNYTLLKVLNHLYTKDSDNKLGFKNNNSNLFPKKETLENILAYAKSVKCHKTKSIDNVLLVLN